MSAVPGGVDAYPTAVPAVAQGDTGGTLFSSEIFGFELLEGGLGLVVLVLDGFGFFGGHIGIGLGQGVLELGLLFFGLGDLGFEFFVGQAAKGAGVAVFFFWVFGFFDFFGRGFSGGGFGGLRFFFEHLLAFLPGGVVAFEIVDFRGFEGEDSGGDLV